MDRNHKLSQVLCLALAAIAIAAFLSGCGQRLPVADKAGESAEAPKASATSVPLDPRLHEPFADATTDPPAEWHRPPDTTLTQKSVGKLYTDVVRAWDDIHFVSPTGKRVAYRATLDTEL